MRSFIVAAAQMGPNPDGPNPGSAETRAPILARMLRLLEEAASAGARLVVFPETALTTFFPRRLISDATELAACFEHESASASLLDNPHVKPLLSRAFALGLDVSFGYCERWTDEQKGTTTDYNTAVYFSCSGGDSGHGRILSKYRKVHLPGTPALVPSSGDNDLAQQLEKYYFTPGNLGFQAFRVPGLLSPISASTPTPDVAAAASSDAAPPILGMLICNDRRWPEAWRCYGLQGAEVILCGYNTTDWRPQDLATATAAEQEELSLLHHHISCQSGSYQNACFGVHVAKAGVEAPGRAGGGLIGGTVIYDPLGRVVAKAISKDDELVVATLNLDLCRKPRASVFNFAKHRRLEHYGRIVNQVGVEEPAWE